MGRRKIEIQPLTDDRNRTVTFVKRKAGLFKKAHELAVLCQVDLAVIIVGSNNKIYEFSSVDTGELMKYYKGVKSPHESKSPENYGNYKKKKHLNDRSNGSTSFDNESIGDEQIDSDYDSETPEPKRQKRSYQEANNSSIYQNNSKKRPNPPSHISLSQVPSFNTSFTKKDKKDSFESLKSVNEDSSSGRPVLRVQIPIDARANHDDSAKTLTALESNVQGAHQRTPESSSSNLGPGSHNDGTSMPNVNSVKYSNFSTFKSPETKKPITTLPLPIHPKSQTSSPSSATAPGLPMSGISFFNSLPQGSPNSQYPNSSILPTPILNQVFGHHNQSQQNMQVMGNSNQKQGLHHHGSDINAQQNRAHTHSSDPSLDTSQHSTQDDLNMDNRSTLNSTGNDVSIPGSNQASAGTSQGKHRPPGFASNQYMNGEQTPSSVLPSRYIGDMFPSPSNFYASQEWSNSGSMGMTPIHNILPQYFVNMQPNGNQPHNGKQASHANPQPPPIGQHSNSHHPQQQSSNTANKSEVLPSPFQFMGSFNGPMSSMPANHNGVNHGPRGPGK